MDYFENIALSESFILGWIIEEKSISIYLELYLLNSHDQYIEFDHELYSGCFKLGVLNFWDISGSFCIKEKTKLPNWHHQLKEYIDIGEIENLEIKNNNFTCEADDISFNFQFSKFSFEIFDSQRFEI